MERRTFIKAGIMGLMVPNTSFGDPGSPYLSSGWIASGATSTFSPSSLSPKLWYKKSSISGTTTWTDSGSLASNGTFTTTTNAPTVVNGTSVQFTTVASGMNTSAFASIASPWSLFMRMRVDTWSLTNDHIFTLLASGASVDLTCHTSTPNVDYRDNAAGGYGTTDNSDLTVSTWHTFYLIYAAGSVKMGVDSNTAVTNTNTLGNQSATQLYLGQWDPGSGGGQCTAATYAEVVLIPSAVSGTDLTNMISYMGGL